MDWSRNNLSLSENPYLRQHKDNPVWWQEWSPAVWEYARASGKPVLVSVGYSTCHWCHVMAADAFSDPECADILNRNFVAIKLDREARPDIDQFLMAFLVGTTGQGGWPLNAFLTPSGDPFFAMTYAASTPRFGRAGFGDILTKVREFFDAKKDEISSFDPGVLADRTRDTATGDLDSVTADLARSFDREHGGFGTGQKFPPHSTLLFMFYASASQPGENQLVEMAGTTLDSIISRGLHDHLQGGFFRYCVDREWTIPHFEKMLYDQAMLLWVLSAATAVTGKTTYRRAAHGVFTCLEETFRIGDFYAAAHDADTNHVEGLTYVWDEEELKSLLTDDEWEAFSSAFDITAAGNFEGKNHLVRRSVNPEPDDDPDLVSAMRKVLEQRRTRPQPFRDEKFLTGWNCLAGCALIAAHRHIELEGALERANQIGEALVAAIGQSGTVPHELHDEGRPRTQTRYLEDYGAALLFLEMLCEPTARHDALRERLAGEIETFKRDGRWIESDNPDFREVAAQWFDSPSPSSISLAEAALYRRELSSNNEYSSSGFSDPQIRGFHGVTELVRSGLFYIVESDDHVQYSQLPVNSILRPGPEMVTCYKGECYRGLPRNPE